MKKLSDYVLISDIDGTLLRDDGVLPQRNIDAIERFISKGGHFGLATGRSRPSMELVSKQLPINAPCITYNGGEIFDYQKNKVLLELFLPESIPGYMPQILQALPTVGVVVVRKGIYHLVQEAAYPFPRLEGAAAPPAKKQSLAQLTGSWQKLLFQVQEGEGDAILRILQEMEIPDIRIVASSGQLVEMIPLRSSKGNALEVLIADAVIDRKGLVVIGDYYNDVEMIEMAGLGVTLSTSPPEIRQKADLIVGSNADGAVAELIEYLEQECCQ